MKSIEWCSAVCVERMWGGGGGRWLVVHMYIRSWEFGGISVQQYSSTTAGTASSYFLGWNVECNTSGGTAGRGVLEPSEADKKKMLLPTVL